MGIKIPEINLFVTHAFIVIIINANFDKECFVCLIKSSVAHREILPITAQ
jgi:hydroxylamine reductase (hybrid-cluster protein)